MSSNVIDLNAGRVRELDGIRALAVVAVIAYHFGAPAGGQAGVTTFFALSGFIVATLLLSEQERTGRLQLRKFSMRRVRRLLPAATAVVIATLVTGRILDKPPIGRQALAALTYWADIERFTSRYHYGQSVYAPLEHFWSLAVEEQFYVLLPLMCLLLLRRGRRTFGAVTALCLLASVAFAIATRDEPQMYFHPAARVCELLAGVVFATFGRRVPAWLGAVGLAVLTAILAGVITPAPIITAVVTCLVIAGLPRVLRWRPLVIIGTYSYGLYLWHPLAAILSDRLAYRIAFTIGFAFFSYHLLEYPIRRSMTMRSAVTSMAVLSVTAFGVLALPTPAARINFVAAAPVIATAPVIDVTSATTAPIPSPNATVFASPATLPPRPAQGSTTTTEPPPPPALRISGAGDSTQMFLDPALEAWADAYPGRVQWVRPPDAIVPWTSGADGWVGKEAAALGLSLPNDGPQGGIDRQGCPLIYDLQIRPISRLDFFDTSALHSATPVASCDWHLWIPHALSKMHLDVLVVSWGVTGMWQYRMPDGSVGHVGEAAFDALLAERMTAFEDMAARFGTRVLWLTYQPLSADPTARDWTSTEYADSLAAVMVKQPCVADLRSLIRNDEQFDWYQDGYHLTAEGAAKVVAEIAPAISRCAARSS